MAAGLAALLGLLGGGGKGAAEGYGAGLTDELNEKKLAEQKREFDAANFTPTAELPDFLRKLVPAGAPTVRNTLIPAYTGQYQKDEAARLAAEKNANVGAALENNTFGPRAGSLPVSADAPGMLAPDAPTRDPLIAALGPVARAGEADKGMAVLQEILKQRVAGAGGEDGGATMTFRDTDEGVIGFKHGKKSGKFLGATPTGFNPQGSKGVYTPAHINERIDLEHATPGQPGYGQYPPGSLARATRYADLAKQFMVPAGGATYGFGGGLPPAITPVPGAPAPAAPPRPIATREFQPATSERDELKQLDASMAQLNKIMTALSKPGGFGDVMGGVFKNPIGAGRRLSDEYLGVGLSQEQRGGLATMALELQKIKKYLIGSTRTSPELKDIAAAIPDEKNILSGANADQLFASMQALYNGMANERRAWENVLSGSDVKVPGQPAAAKPVWRLKETATGRVRTYEPAPGETQPPAGYEFVK